MAIFTCYVSSPEGKTPEFRLKKCRPERPTMPNLGQLARLKTTQYPRIWYINFTFPKSIQKLTHQTNPCIPFSASNHPNPCLSIVKSCEKSLPSSSTIFQVMFHHEFHLKPGWWFQPLWKMMEFVSWDDDIPNWMESHNPAMFQTTNQY